MFWFYYYILPAAVAWKLRKTGLVDAVFSLYGTMLAAFLAVWCEPWVRTSLLRVAPPEKAVAAWAAPAALLLVWFITAVVFKRIRESIVQDGAATLIFPEKVEKYLPPCIIFLHTGLICALLFVIVSAMPLAKYTAFVTQDPSMCSATRYRILWNSFFIDRLSFQQAGVNQRRRAFDRFVPEDTTLVRAPDPANRRQKEK